MAHQIATKRVPLRPDTFERFRDFSNGLGLRYDEAIAILLNQLQRPDESAFDAGRRLKAELSSPPRPSHPGGPYGGPNGNGERMAQPRGAQIGKLVNYNPKPGKGQT